METLSIPALVRLYMWTSETHSNTMRCIEAIARSPDPYVSADAELDFLEAQVERFEVNP
jgi:hypothetical protein